MESDYTRFMCTSDKAKVRGNTVSKIYYIRSCAFKSKVDTISIRVKATSVRIQANWCLTKIERLNQERGEARVQLAHALRRSWVLPNLTDKFRGMIVESMGTTNHHRT
ncbi:hypothetical protein TNCV_3175561 [Trichonephila clavipes]|nr:hypothetical protein TNCV_3175561 [Trichonephila clavipes]